MKIDFHAVADDDGKEGGRKQSEVACIWVPEREGFLFTILRQQQQQT